MEIKDYNLNCLDSAMQTLGEAFNYAVNSCGLTLNEFMELFIASGYAKMFEDGNPKIISGISGIELAMDIFTKVNINKEYKEEKISYSVSPEYWCGWILAYYQWKTGLSFKYIYSQLSMEEILKLYPTLHEASEEKFVDVVNSIIKSKVKTTRLQAMRKLRGLSQAELAKKSGVNLRTLQEYEVGSKDINKISLINAIALTKVLDCTVEDIVEII